MAQEGKRGRNKTEEGKRESIGLIIGITRSLILQAARKVKGKEEGLLDNNIKKKKKGKC